MITIARGAARGIPAEIGFAGGGAKSAMISSSWHELTKHQCSVGDTWDGQLESSTAPARKRRYLCGLEKR